MKHFLKKAGACALVIAVAAALSEATGQDPVWYLLSLWLWKDLSETLDRHKGG